MTNERIYFTNLDKSPMAAGETAKEKELKDRIETEYINECIESSEKFNAKLTKALGKVKNPAYYGTAVKAVLEESSRYIYIKNYDNKCDIEIDTLFHTFRKLYY